MNVTLDWFEMVMASDVGMRREVNARVKKMKDSLYKDDTGSWGSHIESASAEMAVAKALGLYWDGSVNVGRRADLPRTFLEVRWNQNPARRSAKVKPHDEGIVIAVAGNSPDFVLLGWIKCVDAQRDEYKSTLSNGSFCFFAPEKVLSKDFGELGRQLRNQPCVAELAPRVD